MFEVEDSDSGLVCSSDDDDDDNNDDDDDDDDDNDNHDDSDNSDDDSDNDSESDDDGPSDDVDENDDDSVLSATKRANYRLQLLLADTRVDEHADRLIQMGIYVSAGKVLILSLKIANKIESIERAAQEAGTSCILALTQLNLRNRDIVLNNLNNIQVANGNNNNNNNNNNNDDNETEKKISDCNKSETTIVEQWKENTNTIKLDAMYSWYRNYHGALTDLNLKNL